MNWEQRKELVKSTLLEFMKEKSLFHGAALSYYALLALVPILYLSVTYVGGVIGHDVMLEIVAEMLEDRIGLEDASSITGFLDSVNLGSGSILLQVVGILALMFSCTVIFNSLKRSINEFYDIELQHRNVKKKIIGGILSRLISLSFTIGLTLIVIILYFVQTFILSLSDEIFGHIEFLNQTFALITRYVIPMVTNIFIFSFIFKYLNNAKVEWRIAIRGAVVTSVMLYIGQLLIKYYLTNFFFAANAGAAGTILIILVWVYYSSQIIFLGAKYIAVRSRMLGFPIRARD